MPMQGHATGEAWPLLPGQFHQKRKRQLQVHPNRGPAGDPKTAQELRNHEDTRRLMDRSGHRTIQPASLSKSNMILRRTCHSPVLRELIHSSIDLYQPLTNGVDLIKRKTGRLLYRIEVTVTVANVSDYMLLGQSTGTLGFLVDRSHICGSQQPAFRFLLHQRRFQETHMLEH
jgi:hypothetical protein